jgi:hypothetical protein
MSKVKGIEIEGLTELRKAFEGIPKEVEASVVRNIARKPSNKIISVARHLLPSDSGVTARSLGILKVKDRKQMFVELGIKAGRSLAYIYMFWKGHGRVKKTGESTGKIKPTGNVIERAADKLRNTTMREMAVDISKVIAKAFKRHARKR